MHSPSEDNSNSRTLYVGNLDATVTEDLLMALFTQIGPCKNCKIIHDSTSDPYAFIEFTEHQAAAHALLAMNKRLVLGKEIKVNWATTSTNTTNKVDTSKHHHIFVGDLAPEVDQNTLLEAFAPFGEISEVKIAKFPDTQKPKGYCFIAFTNQNDAETAITSMNGQWLGTRKIRTNWATRKAATTTTTTATENTTNSRARDSNQFQYTQESSTPRLDYNEVWNRTSDTNATVYVGGCPEVNEELVRSVFAPFGHIQEIRIFKEKGYAFVRFSSKESACQAICRLHGSDVHGSMIKCSWGRDESNNDRTNAGNYGNGNHMDQYNSYSQNSYGPPLYNNHPNNYMSSGNDRGGYGGSYPQQDYYPPQYHQPSQQQWNNNFNGPPANPTWDSYPSPMNNGGGGGGSGNWNNNNHNYPAPNFNQYNHPQQSHMYPSQSGWRPSRR